MRFVDWCSTVFLKPGDNFRAVDRRISVLDAAATNLCNSFSVSKTMTMMPIQTQVKWILGLGHKGNWKKLGIERKSVGPLGMVLISGQLLEQSSFK
jgi:hypothetical protein